MPSARLVVPASKPSTVLAATDSAPVLATVVVPWSEITPEETCTVPAPLSLKVMPLVMVLWPVPPVLERIPALTTVPPPLPAPMPPPSETNAKVAPASLLKVAPEES